MDEVDGLEIMHRIRRRLVDESKRLQFEAEKLDQESTHLSQEASNLDKPSTLLNARAAMMRARAQVEERESSGKTQIVVTEIPFMVNKTRLIEQIAERVRLKKVADISDLRDESDRDGMRLVIELKICRIVARKRAKDLAVTQASASGG